MVYNVLNVFFSYQNASIRFLYYNFFLNEIITFIHQSHIKWLKSDIKVKGFKIFIFQVLLNFLFMKTFWEKYELC